MKDRKGVEYKKGDLLRCWSTPSEIICLYLGKNNFGNYRLKYLCSKLPTIASTWDIFTEHRDVMWNYEVI